MIKKTLLATTFILSSCCDSLYLHDIYDTDIDKDLKASYVRVFSNDDGKKILADLIYKGDKGAHAYDHEILMLSEGIKAVYNYILAVSQKNLENDLVLDQGKTNIKDGDNDKSIKSIQTIN